MEYKVGQKFLLKSRRCRIATIVHIHNKYCLVSYNEGDADLFTKVEFEILFEPYREPIKTVTEIWIAPETPEPNAILLNRLLGIAAWNLEKEKECATKVRITVEGIE